MTKTGLYIPLLNFKINNTDGEKILFENLVQSGPSYRLIVHDSPAWRSLSENIASSEEITIISDKEAESYIELAKKFFAPVTESAKYYETSGTMYPMINLTADLRRALSYILIGHRYKARIFDDSIFDIDYKLPDMMKSQTDFFGTDAIKRIEFVTEFLKAYKHDKLPTLSTNCNAKTFDELITILEKEEVKELSGINHLFGQINAEKNTLKRDIEQKITEIVKYRWFPHLTGAAALGLGYIPNLTVYSPIIAFLADVGSQELSNYDFREFAPPIEDSDLFRWGKPINKARGFSTVATMFNDEISFLVNKKAQELLPSKYLEKIS
jgi:hypothetical protein